MLTFFRQIRKSLLGYGAARKYLLYAIGEILLVMIGILLALQVNNWNEERQRQISQHIALHGLKDEFTKNLEKLKLKDGNRIKWISKCDSLLQISRIGRKERTSYHLVPLVHNCFRTPTFDPYMGQYNSVVNSGRIELINNDSLRFLLSTWSGIIEDAREEQNISRDFGWEILNTFIPENVDLTDDPNKAYAILLSDFRFKSIIQRQKSMHELISNQSDLNLKTPLIKILTLMDCELGKDD